MRKIIKELAVWLVYIVIVVIIAWGFVTFVAQRTQVSGSSMETTLSDGDQLIVDKISYQLREPERYILYQADHRTARRDGTDPGRFGLY